MASIYNLTSEFEYLQNLLLMADPDTEEEIQKALKITSDEIEDKAEGYAHVIFNLESDIAGLKAEESRLAEWRKVKERAVERLKSNLFEAMVTTGKTKFNKGNFRFSIQKNGGADPVLVDVAADELPDEFCKIKREPDKKALADYMKETGDFTYSHFGERGSSLRIK